MTFFPPEMSLNYPTCGKLREQCMTVTDCHSGTQVALLILPFITLVIIRVSAWSPGFTQLHLNNIK